MSVYFNSMILQLKKLNVIAESKPYTRLTLKRRIVRCPHKNIQK